MLSHSSFTPMTLGGRRQQISGPGSGDAHPSAQSLGPREGGVKESCFNSLTCIFTLYFSKRRVSFDIADENALYINIRDGKTGIIGSQ